MIKQCFTALTLLFILQFSFCGASSEGFKEIISKLLNIISEETHSAKQKVDEIVTNVTKLGQDIIHKSSNDFNNIIECGLDQINAFKQGVGDISHEASLCIEKKKQEIKDIPGTIVHNLENCITEKVNEAKNLTKRIVGDISNTIDLIKYLETRYDNCGWGFKSILCYTEVTAEAGSQIIQVPIKIGMDVSKIRYMIATINTNLSLCGLRVAALAVGKVVADVAQCVAQ